MNIIEMAREAGFSFETGQDLRDNIPALERFAALVAAHEREACAKVCDEEGLLLGQRYAAAIRARGE